MPHPPTSPPPAGVPVLAAGEEFRVTEDFPGDVRLCRIRVAEDECQGCVALLGDADQRPALEYLAQAGNRAADLATLAARAEAAEAETARMREVARRYRQLSTDIPLGAEGRDKAFRLCEELIGLLMYIEGIGYVPPLAGAVAAPGGSARGEG